MTIQQLITNHLDIWTAADTAKKSGRGRSSGNAASVYGIKKLRELIYELAATGRIVDHKNDAKQYLLGEVSEFVMGQAPPGNECNTNGEGVIFVKTGEFGSLFPEVKEWTTKPLKLAKNGDVLICVVGATIGKLNLAIDCAIGRSVAAIRPVQIIETKYLYFVLTPFTLKLRERSRGSAQGVIGKAELSSVKIRVPSINEQRQIVTKVDELMALCDQLEAQHSNAAEAHEKLVNHLLGTLTLSQSAEDFSTNWQRIAAHFDTLFTTEASINALKQTLLQIAVMGKLVPQDPNDEPASELLKRLRMDRTKWLSKKEKNDPECRSMQKKLAALPEGKAPFILPISWATVHLIDCCRLLVDCHNKTAPYSASGIPIIRTSNIRERKFRMEDLKYVSENTYQFWSRRCLPEPGDIMFTREAPMGEAAIIPLGAKYCLGQRTMLVRPMHNFIFNEYLLITLTEPHLLERSSDSAIGSTVKHLRVGAVEELNIPLPPIAEQHRIVAKVDELMAICDQLKPHLTEANQLQQKLADVLVEQATSQ